MNLEQAKAKLSGVSNGTAVKHPKVLIAELCSVVQFLLEELDQASKLNPVVINPPKTLEELSDEHKPAVRLPWDAPTAPVQPRKRMGNAGDAE